MMERMEAIGNIEVRGWEKEWGLAYEM